MITTSQEVPLAGKVALVTGASRGIGAAIACRLAADGARVALTYATSAGRALAVVAEIEQAGGRAVALEADAADVEATRAAVAATVETFGALDVLVNNAGMMVGAPIEHFALEDFERLIAVNVRGLFVATQEASRHMRAGGRIIHVGSCNSTRITYPGGSVYALTKGAVAGFTKGLARDLGPRGITVSNVQPGPVDTDMNPATSDFAEVARREVALGRYGRADEIAAFVAFLAGPGGSFVSGASLLVDGGYCA